MKVLLVTGSLTGIPLMQWLMQQRMLCGLLLQEELASAMPSIEQSFKQVKLPFLAIKKSQLREISTKNWVEGLKADVVIVFGFSWIVPKPLLSITTYGWYNIHFSKLPCYKGPAPVFWQIKNGEKETAITIHKMIEKADEGDIAIQQVLPIPTQVTNSSFNWMLGNLTPTIVDAFFREKRYDSNNKVQIDKQLKPSYYPRPTVKDYTINWVQQTAFEIENLVNATNPIYGGAIAYYKQQEIRIIQASQVSINGFDAKSGSITTLKANEGLVVKAAQETYLSVEVVSTSLGILTANRFVALYNIQQNDFFN